MKLTALALALFSTALFAEQLGPWDVDSLKRSVPQMKWVSQERPVWSLIYEGERYVGRQTEVFAFYASPKTLGSAQPGQRFPGVVLIHGGGGTAFAEWAYLWAKRGYAAIAMDLAGMRPPEPEWDENGAFKRADQSEKSRTKLHNGGPNQSHAEKFDSIGGDVSDDWPFHAVASVIRAHSLLRSFPEVDAGNTAVTGISWGGYTTCLVASLDDRFNAAVPVYGCGFLHEGESVQKPSIDKLAERRMDWVREYDPGSYLHRCRVPMLFVNGTNDVHYVLDSYMKSYALVPGEKQIRVQVKMPHGHSSGWAPGEIGWFIDSKCKGGEPLPVPGKPRLDGDRVVLSVASKTPLKEARLHYTVDSGVRSKREWVTVSAAIQGDEISGPKPPSEANTWFVSITDMRGAMVSTEVVFNP